MFDEPARTANAVGRYGEGSDLRGVEPLRNRAFRYDVVLGRRCACLGRVKLWSTPQRKQRQAVSMGAMIRGRPVLMRRDPVFVAMLGSGRSGLVPSRLT